MSDASSLLDDILGDLRDSPDYVAETMSLRVVEDALAIMESTGMTKARLADAMHVSRAYVTKVFNAPPNLTLRTVAQLALAVGARPTLRLEPIGMPAVAVAPLAADPSVKPQLKRGENLLTRDARMKERKKPGLKRARKAPQFTKR